MGELICKKVTAWVQLRHKILPKNESNTTFNPKSCLEPVFFNTLKASGVRCIRFHDLRHTAAILMIGRGVPPKLVSKLLGHASVAFTLQIYIHVFEEQETGATLDLSDLE